jgi:hypothetical protein
MLHIVGQFGQQTGCTESERSSKLDRAKDYFHTTNPQIWTGPHALRPCVLQCAVYHGNTQALPVGKQPTNNGVPVDKSEMN